MIEIFLYTILFLWAGVGILNVFVFDPWYILYLRKNYTEIWERDLDELGLFPDAARVILFSFLLKNKFKKTQNKRFITISYIHKYSTFGSIMSFIILFGIALLNQ